MAESGARKGAACRQGRSVPTSGGVSRSVPLEQVRYGNYGYEHRRYRDDGANELHHGLSRHVLLSGGALRAASRS